MARRRPADAENTPAQDDLPLPSTVDLSNGKTRTPAEKASRFFRNRPVSSLLLIISVCAIAIITFSVGRSVGKAVSVMFGSKPDQSASTASARRARINQLAHALNHSDPDPHLQDADDDDEANANDKSNNLADDERGVLVDGASGKDTIAIIPENHASSKRHTKPRPTSQTCHRKFEPGKLGSPKMLCVTDEFYFDISVGTEAIGRMKIGVFGEVVPKSAANFRALATCTGVFADDNSCYRGDSFHRVVNTFVAQGGSKATGRSIFGHTFREEQSSDHHSFLEHDEKGVVSWAEYPIGSQFFILIRDEAKYLDSNHVVFGVVTEGMDVLDKIHNAPRSGEEPLSQITITDCGDVHKTV